jgi:hypothetical protein
MYSITASSLRAGLGEPPPLEDRGGRLTKLGAIPYLVSHETVSNTLK